MNINDEINKLREYQNFTGGYTAVALENIKMAPFLFLDYIDKADFELGDEEIRVYLTGSLGIRAWFYRTFKKKEITKSLTLLGKYIHYWTPKTKITPKIKFYWGQMPDDK